MDLTLDMPENNDFKIIGYHGTDLKSGEDIINSGFRVVDDEEGWLGQGIYLFIDGIRNGLDMAADWSCSRRKSSFPVVVKCLVRAPWDAVLDLRNSEQLKAFDEARHQYARENFDTLMERRDLKIKKRRDIRLDDAIVAKEILNRLDKSILVHNVYVKSRILRELALESSYPTATVCCVGNTSHIKSTCLENLP